MSLIALQALAAESSIKLALQLKTPDVSRAHWPEEVKLTGRLARDLGNLLLQVPTIFWNSGVEVRLRSLGCVAPCILL